MSKYIKIVALLTSFIAIFLVFFTAKRMFTIVDNTPISLHNFELIFSSPYIWNDYLKSPSVAQSVLNYNTYFIWLGKLFNLNVTQILVLVKSSMMFLAFLGIVLWLDYLNKYFFNRRISLVLIILAGLLYVVDPSFFIGDHFWVSIQVGYYSSPLVGYLSFRFFHKTQFASLCVLALLLSINTAGHFVYGGFVAVIGFVWILEFFLSRRSASKLLIQFLKLLTVGLVYVLSLAPQILGTAQVVSDVVTYLTKEAISNPWSTAFIYNMVRGMSLTNIADDFFNFRGWWYSITINSLTYWPAVLIFIGSWFRLSKKKYRSELSLDIFFSYLVFVLLLIIAIFAIEGPLKIFHYYLTLDFSLGKVLRTWRVPETLVWMCISLLFPVSSYYIIHKRSYLRPYIYTISALSIIAFISPIFFGKINGILIKTPYQYQSIFNNVEHDDNVNVIFSPEMISSYGETAPLKPIWSPKMGMMTEFLGYSSPFPSIIPADSMRHFYFFTASEFYGKTGNLIQNSDFFALARMLALANVKFLVLRNDGNTELINNGIISKILNSQWWKPLNSQDGLTLLQNTFAGASVSLFQRDHVFFTDGGYRATAEFLKRNEANLDNFLFLYIDQDVKSTYVGKKNFFITDKDEADEYNNLLINNKKNENIGFNGNILFPATFIQEHDPDNIWSNGNLLDIHQTEWHPYVNHMNGYAWDFEFNKGLIFTLKEGTNISLPLKKIVPGNYVLLVRYLNNDSGGNISLSVGGTSNSIDTHGNYDGFMWEKKFIVINDGDDVKSIVVTNNSGFNAISVIALLKQDYYENEVKLISSGISDSVQFSVGINPSDNIIPEGDFEDNDKAKWHYIKGAAEYNISTSADLESGLSALSISTSSNNPEWSWVGSDWINVESGRQYEFRTHMKVNAAIDSHIVLLGYDSINNREIQLAQLPNATSGKVEWSEFSKRIIMDNNISRVRVVLNAGWSEEAGVKAETLFDGISITPLEGNKFDLISPQKNNCQLNYNHQNPTLWKIYIPENCGTDFFLSLDERYDDGWQASIKPYGIDDSSKSFSEFSLIPANQHVVGNGFSNVWAVDTKNLGVVDSGNGYEVTLEFIPQKLFHLGLLISGTTLLSCLGYLGYDLVKRRRSRKLEKAIRFKNC